MTIGERASNRFRRRRIAWTVATKDATSFAEAATHSTFRLMEQANDLLLRLPEKAWPTRSTPARSTPALATLADTETPE